MKGIVFFLLIVTLASSIAPTIHEQRNMGFYKFPELLYVLSVDCDSAVVNLTVIDANFTGISEVGTHIKYVDYSTPLISSERTGEDGFVEHQLPGNTSLMRGMFILVIEKKGYRSREIHFDISRCYSPEPELQPEEPVEQEPAETEELPPPPVQPKPAANNTINETAEETDEAEACLPAMFIALLMIFNFFRG